MNFEDYFYYDESSPTCLRWKVSKPKRNKHPSVNVGDIAGVLYRNGYYNVSILSRHYLVHRIICSLHMIEVKGLTVDHIDGNRTNNCINNLRAVTIRLNTQNSKKQHNNKTGVTGVSYEYKNGDIKLVRASCYDLGQHITKAFSVNKYGLDEAFRLACEARKQMINELSAQPLCNYTERHGK